MALACISHSECRLHAMGEHHPERPARLAAISDKLRAAAAHLALDYREAPRASREQLAAVHDPAYIAQIFAAAPAAGRVRLDADTALNPHSLEAALRAAGAVLLGVDLVMQEESGKAFCPVRPPGHHAERGRAMGFCLFNNVAAGALHALDKHGLERVAIVDFDVHHGNGTEDIVAGDERILFCSTFQHPFYPFTGTGPTAANVVNTPLPAGSDGAVFRQAVARDWLPRLASFAPQLILVSAGFDAHRDDDMGGLELEAADYAWVTQRLCEQARASAHGRIVSALEGGYELNSLASSVAAHLEAMQGE